MIVPSSSRVSRSATSRVGAGQWTVHGMTLRYGAPETYPIRVTPFTPLAEFAVDSP